MVKIVHKIIICYALFFSMLLTSCSDDVENMTTELKFWVMPNFPDPQNDTERLIRGFEHENPGVKVKVTILDWGSAWTKITMAASAQNGPDILQMPTTWSASITEMGALMSLDSLVYNMGGEERFVDVTLESARPRASDSITSLPWFIDVRPYFYRKDVLSKLGVEKNDIKDRSDFYTVLEMIKDAKPIIEKRLVQPLGYPGKNDWNIIHNFSPWIWGAGGSVLSDDAMKANLSSPESLDGIMFFLEMIRDGFNERRNLEKNTAQVSSDFDNGDLAFWKDAAHKLIYLQRPAFLETHSGRKSAAVRNFGVMLPPTAPRGLSKEKSKYFVGGSNLSIFNFSKKKELSMKLIQYLCGRQDVQMKMTRMSGLMPTLKTTYVSPYFLRDPNRKIFVDLVKNGRSYPAVHYWGEIETSILIRRFGNIFDLITGSSIWPQKEIIQELKETDAEINDYIKTQLKNRPELVKKLKAYSEQKKKLKISSVQNKE